jgi:hypothetical protein
MFFGEYMKKNKNFILEKWRSLLSLLLINIFFAFIYYFICNDEEDWEESSQDLVDDEKYPINKFFRRLYFSFVVFSSVGFGDILPRSKKAKSIVIIQIILTMMGILQIVY